MTVDSSVVRCATVHRGRFTAVGQRTTPWGTALGHAFAAAAVQIPAVLVLAAVALTLYGHRPNWTVAAWAMIVAAFLVGPLGALFNLPQWLRDISPLTHVPLVPAEPMRWASTVVLLVIAVAIVGVGWVRFTRRDVGN